MQGLADATSMVTEPRERDAGRRLVALALRR